MESQQGDVGKCKVQARGRDFKGDQGRDDECQEGDPEKCRAGKTSSVLGRDVESWKDV